MRARISKCIAGASLRYARLQTVLQTDQADEFVLLSDGQAGNLRFEAIEHYIDGFGGQQIAFNRLRFACHQHPGGLLTLASAGWLGYSLFFDGKTKEEQHRHLWGLGAGALGYLYGPESLQWVKKLTIPKADGERAVGMFRDGSILLGATIGGFAGYTLGKRDTHA